MTNQTKALLAILGAAFFGGGISVWTKMSLKEIPAMTFIFLRFLIAYIVMSPWLLKEKRGKKILSPILISLFPMANIIFFIFGIQLTTATVAQIIYSFVPIFTAIGAYWLIKEKFNLKKIGGMLLGFSGLTLIMIMSLNNAVSHNLGSFKGNLLIFLGAGAYALYPIFSKKLQNDYSPKYLTGVFFLVTTIVTGMMAWPELININFWWQQVSFVAWLSLLATAVFGTTIFYLLMQYAVKYGSAVIGTLSLYIQPVATFFWASLLLNEQISWLIIVSGLLVVGGAYITTKAKS